MNELWPQRQDVGQEEDGAAFRAGKMGLLSERGWLPPVIGVCPAVSSSAQVGALVANKCLVGDMGRGQRGPWGQLRFLLTHEF